MSTNQRQTKRLREEIVVANESDLHELKTRMIDHLRASKLACSTKLLGERDSGRGAEYVKDGSVAMRSGTIGYSKNHLELGFGFGPKETDHWENLELSGTGCSPNRPSQDSNLFNKKTLQHSSELALFRRSPTANFGLVKSQETESFAARAVDSYMEVGVRRAQATRETREAEAREAQATRELKRKLNPFLREQESEREASATRQMLSEGIMPPERVRGLTLPKSLTLEQFVAIMTPHSGILQNPKFHKNDIHSTTTSFNSDSGNLHATLHTDLNLDATMTVTEYPGAGTVTPDESGEALFSRAICMLTEEESVHRFDCNTVGPVPVASGYGSRTLTQSAAHMLFGSKENASSLQNEARSLEVSGIPVLESRDRGTKMTSFIGSTVSVMPIDQMDRTKAIGATPKSSHFTLSSVVDS